MDEAALNNWYRAQAAIFDASLAYEFFGFGGPDAREGLASHTEKRPPRFEGRPATSSARTARSDHQAGYDEGGPALEVHAAGLAGRRQLEVDEALAVLLALAPRPCRRR